MRSIVLDTTFVLPLFGIRIDISDNFHDELRMLWKGGVKGYKLYLPSVCLLESLYLLNREYRISKDSAVLDRYPMVLPSITNSQIVEIIDALKNEKIIGFSNKLRVKGHNDLMDCLIAATAKFKNGILLTRDKELANVMKEVPEFNSVEIWDWSDIKKTLG